MFYCCSILIWGILLALFSFKSRNDRNDFLESIRFICFFVDLFTRLISKLIFLFFRGVPGVFLYSLCFPITSYLIWSIVWWFKLLKPFASFLRMNSICFQICSSTYCGAQSTNILVISYHLSSKNLIWVCINSSIF